MIENFLSINSDIIFDNYVEHFVIIETRGNLFNLKCQLPIKFMAKMINLYGRANLFRTGFWEDRKI